MNLFKDNIIYYIIIMPTQQKTKTQNRLPSVTSFALDNNIPYFKLQVDYKYDEQKDFIIILKSLEIRIKSVLVQIHLQILIFWAIKIVWLLN